MYLSCSWQLVGRCKDGKGGREGSGRKEAKACPPYFLAVQIHLQLLQKRLLKAKVKKEFPKARYDLKGVCLCGKTRFNRTQCSSPVTFALSTLSPQTRQFSSMTLPFYFYKNSGEAFHCASSSLLKAHLLHDVFLILSLNAHDVVGFLSMWWWGRLSHCFWKHGVMKGRTP